MPLLLRYEKKEVTQSQYCNGRSKVNQRLPTSFSLSLKKKDFIFFFL